MNGGQRANTPIVGISGGTIVGGGRRLIFQLKDCRKSAKG